VAGGTTTPYSTGSPPSRKPAVRGLGGNKPDGGPRLHLWARKEQTSPRVLPSQLAIQRSVIRINVFSTDEAPSPRHISWNQNFAFVEGVRDISCDIGQGNTLSQCEYLPLHAVAPCGQAPTAIILYPVY
jgi:hypothetical protein